jgi:hypothetical protein
MEDEDPDLFPRAASLHMAAIAATSPSQPGQMNCSTQPPAAWEDTMIGNDLIVEVPWIIFAISLVAVCLRLRRFRLLSGRSRDRDAHRPSDDGNDSSANTSKPGGNDHHGPAMSSWTQS